MSGTGADLPTVAAPRCAVLFKTHSWDDFAARQFVALQAPCATAHLLVVVDETQGPVTGIPHDNVLGTHERDMFAPGLPAQEGVSLNWNNTNYQMFALHQAHPDYALYNMVEFNAVVQCDLDALAAGALRRGIGLIGSPGSDPLEPRYWTHKLDEVCPRELMQGQLLCISGLSERAAAARSSSAATDVLYSIEIAKKIRLEGWSFVSFTH